MSAAQRIRDLEQDIDCLYELVILLSNYLPDNDDPEFVRMQIYKEQGKTESRRLLNELE